MAGVLSYGQILLLVIAVLAMIAVAVGVALRARARRLRRARAVLEAEANVVETPPAGPETPTPTAAATGEPAPSDGNDEQPTDPEGGQSAPGGSGDAMTGLNGSLPGVVPAGDAGGRAGGERRAPEPPATGADSALAALDVGRFIASLSTTAGRPRPPIPLRMVTAEDVATEEAEPEPPRGPSS